MFYDIITDVSADVYMSAVFLFALAFCGGFFCYNKGVLMQKVSYMGDGSTTEFYFYFPYFENSNVVVTKNNQTATGYNIIGNSGGLDADIPYNGGKVVFETAPSALDNITISRSLPLSRIVDYQPTAEIEPTALNQDLNYLMEVLKDRKDELDELSTQYSEIADKESTTTLLARISTIHDEIVAIDAKITALGDISQIRNDITGLKDASNLTTTGKAAISHLAMPSSTYDELTFGASGTEYTAPADGWFTIKPENGALTDHWFNIHLNGLYIGNWWGQVANNSFGIPPIPCGKNGTLKITYGTSIKNTSKIRFIYAAGS